MANIPNSLVLAKHCYTGSTHFYDFVSPECGKSSFFFNVKHRLLMVMDSDDTNSNCRHERFAEFQIPSNISLNQLTTTQLLAACVRLPFQGKNGRSYGERFVDGINRACVRRYVKALGLIEV